MASVPWNYGDGANSRRCLRRHDSVAVRASAIHASGTGGRCGLRLHRHMARVSAVREAGIGRKIAGCGVVVNSAYPHPPLCGNLLLSFSMKEACVKPSGTSTTNGASVLFFG